MLKVRFDKFCQNILIEKLGDTREKVNMSPKSVTKCKLKPNISTTLMGLLQENNNNKNKTISNIFKNLINS